MKRPLRVTIDQGVDLRILRALQTQGVVTLHQVHDLEQDFAAVSTQGGAFRLGDSVLDGLEMLAGDEAREVEAIVGRNHPADVAHIHSAFLNHSAYFITEDQGDFIYDGKRERLESLLGLKVRTTKEFLEEIRSQDVD